RGRSRAGRCTGRSGGQGGGGAALRLGAAGGQRRAHGKAKQGAKGFFHGFSSLAGAVLATYRLRLGKARLTPCAARMPRMRRLMSSRTARYSVMSVVLV